MLQPYAAGEGVSLAAGAGLGMLAVALQVLRPWPLKWILDHVSGAGRELPVSGWVADDPLPRIALMCAAFVVIGIAAAGAEFAQTLLLNGLGNRVLFRFRAALFDHILAQPLAFHESHEVGELLTRVVYDTSRLRRGLNGVFVRIFQTLALFLATFLVLLSIAPALAFVLAAGGAIALFTMRRRGRRIASAARKQRRKEGSLAAAVGTELRAIREIQTFGATSSAVQLRFADRNNRSLRQEQKVSRLAAGLSLRVDVVLALSIAIALWLGTRSVLTATITPGDLVLFFSYAISLRAPFADFAFQTARLGRTYACAERLHRIAGRTTSIVDRPDAVPAAAVRGEITFEAAAIKAPRRRRSGRKWTLRRLSAVLPAGQRIAVIGTNGSGKSTLLSLVLRLADPDRGRVLLDGRDLREYALSSLRGAMSVVFQDSVLTGLSVRDNIALGIREASVEDVVAAADAAHASRFIEQLPNGYDTLVRRGGDLFSGGERQRIAIARALLRGGRIWLLDEPTTGLDHRTAEELTAMLLECTRGRTTLWVTHDPTLIPRLDWVLALDQGTAVFSGPPSNYDAWRAQTCESALPG